MIDANYFNGLFYEQINELTLKDAEKQHVMGFHAKA